jgi:hypothetical protein
MESVNLIYILFKKKTGHSVAYDNTVRFTIVNLSAQQRTGTI